MGDYIIKNRLLEIRLEKGYKFQKDFADFLGVDRQDYNKIENNKKQVGMKVAFAIAEKLNMKVDDIFFLNEVDET